MIFLWNGLILINIYIILSLGNNFTIGYSGLMNLAGYIRALKILVADRDDLKATLTEEASRCQREAEVTRRKLAEAEAAIALMQSLAARKDDEVPGTSEGE